MEPDFSGWATRNNLRCSDGRTILPGAFEHQDGARVPLVWNHNQDVPGNIIGHAILEHRDEGVWAKAYLNDSTQARQTKALIQHGDINALSIRANKLQERAKSVRHGNINEVSVVLVGANPGALIEEINLTHADGEDLLDEAIVYTGFEIVHADGEDSEKNDTNTESGENNSEDGDESVADIVDSMNEKQKNVLMYLLGEATSDAEDSDDSAEHSDNNNDTLEHNQEGTIVSRNTIAEAETSGQTIVGKQLSHADRMTILKDAEKLGSLQKSIEMHAEELSHAANADTTYGINKLELLFPDAVAIENTPEFIKREDAWVAGVLSGVTKRPFARIKSLHADITHEEARARGYVRGNLKKEEFFGLQSRTTTPATIYKKQKLDRDDIIDATTVDVVKWLWAEMRMMLNEEIARAILIGDGRDPSSPDKVKEPINSMAPGEGIRSIANDHEFYAYQAVLPAGQNTANMINALIRQRRFYKGSGQPTFYTTADVLTDMLLLEDKLGRALYPTKAELAAKLRVADIVEVEVMETKPDLLGIMVNLKDYVVGTDKGGEISSFDDFDIDYNQYKYLLEGRMSGALVRYRTAIVFKRAEGTEVVPAAPTFNAETNTITIPTTAGVEYSINGEVKTGDVVITEDTWVAANPKPGNYIKPNSTTEWAFTYTAA